MKKLLRPLAILGKFKKLYVFILIYGVILAGTLAVFNSSTAPINDKDDLTKQVVEQTKGYHLESVREWVENLIESIKG